MSVAVWFTDDFPELTYTWINLIQLSNDGYRHLLFICYTLMTQYYHNVTQLDMKFLHLIRYSTLPNRGPPLSLNHNKTLDDMPTYNLVVGSFFALICILKAKSEAKGIKRNLIPTIGEITDFIDRGPFVGLLHLPWLIHLVLGTFGTSIVNIAKDHR